jgi:hypothetical protein
VPIAESIRGFKEILEGKHDDLPERAFFLKGTIDDVVRDAGGGDSEKAAKDDSDDAKGDSDDAKGDSDEAKGDSDEAKGDSDEAKDGEE